MKFVPEQHQEMMIRHMCGRKVSAVLAGMGLGKTAATIAAVKRIIYNHISGALVIAPKNVCLLTWPAEFEQWDQFHKLRAVSLRTPEGLEAWDRGNADFYIINWDYLPKFIEQRMSKLGPNARIPVNTVIYDELSKAKSPSSKRVKQWRRFTYLFDYHIGLTGTPNPNSYMDLFAQFRLLDGGKALGTSFTEFRRKYFYQTDYMGYRWQLLPGAKEKIEAAIQPYTIVLRSEDWLKIPPMEIENREVVMPDKGVKFYKEMQKKMLAQMEGKTVEAANAAVLVNKLLQCTSGAVYNSERDVAVVHDAKINELKAIRKAHKRETLLVVCMFKHEQERLLRVFPDAELFDQSRMKAWNEKRIPMWIIDPRSAGHGLNLQYGGRVLVWMSLTYSRELYDQTNARLARKGQEEVTVVYRMIVPDTVDEAVAAVLEMKGDQQAGLLRALAGVKTLSKR